MLQSLGCICSYAIKAIIYKDYSWKKKGRILNVTEVPFQKNFLRALLGLHAFSECDSTSTFHRIDKRRWFNIVIKVTKSTATHWESLQFGNPLFDMIESMVSQAYGFLNKSNINDARYEKCCAEKFLELSSICLEERVRSKPRNSWRWLIWLGRGRWNL